MGDLPQGSDGCSGGISWFWRHVLDKAPPWEGCCITHDMAYALGGTWRERRQADNALYVCVKQNGHPVWAWIMWLGVRLFGGPYWPHSRRWGYAKLRAA